MSNHDTLSRPTKITSTLSAATLLSISIYSSTTVTLLLPLILSPTLALLYYNSTLPTHHRPPLQTLLYTYLFTSTLSTAALLLVQAILAYTAAYILFGSDTAWFLREFQTVTREYDIRDDAHRAQRAAFAARPSYWVFMVFMTTVLAGCEEVQKYCSIKFAARYDEERRGKDERVIVDARTYVLYGATAGIAFATVEMWMFLVAGAAKASSNYELVRTAMGRFCIGMAAHLLCGVGTAVNVVRKERMGMMRVVMRSALCHGVVNFGLMGFSAARGHVGWVHPEDVMGSVICLAMSAGGIGLLGWLVWEDLQGMGLKVE
ncbi:hypothetical protein PMZ80_006447 [Knufia obscura]|nr:hypothetical protein PMZ80_006447 [Knufia obscura]